MPSPTRDARLRIPSYTVIPEGALSATVKDLIFSLQVSRIQKDITDGADVLVYYGRNSNSLGFSIVRFVITLDGVVTEDTETHTDHPVTTATEHRPDFIDMEEAAVLWNNAATPDGNLDLMPQLEIEFGIAGAFRIYKGLIRELELVRREGKVEVEFKLIFEVAWSVTNPTLREWS